MRDLKTADPADTILAWEAVDELLSVVPDGRCRDVLRLVAAGLDVDEISERLRLPVSDVETLAARGRIRILTAAVSAHGR